MSTAPLPLAVSPASGLGVAESVQNFLDSFGADAVLRSRDYHEVRVPRHYITKFSPVLGALIQCAANSTVPPNAEAPLPVVQLPESGGTLISLLSFISPFTPALPSISAIQLEATMELLSAAQKYEMSSVLAHIRLILAQQDPPFIREGNALRAYSLAQKYGLRQEAVNAAQLTLKYALCWGALEGTLDLMSGAYLHELWMFHERFRTFLLSSDFTKSRTGSTPKALDYISHTPSGIPTWLESYRILAKNLRFFDMVQFQKEWTKHPTQCNCILSPRFGFILITDTDIDDAVHESTKKAESDLSILGKGTHSRDHIGSPTTPLSLPERVDASQADIIVRSSDHVDFRVHKSILACSSPVFNDVFSLPRPSNNEDVDGLPVVQLTEDAGTVRALITTLYPIPSELPTSYDGILALLAAAQKYDMGTVQSSVRAEVSRRSLSALTGTQVFRTYAIASSWRLIPEMNNAARRSLDLPMTFEDIGVELRLFEGWALRALFKFRILYRDNLISCFKSFLDICTGPSKIWISCRGPKPSLRNLHLFEEFARNQDNSPRVDDPIAPQIGAHRPEDGKSTTPGVPAWLYDLFSKGVGGIGRETHCGFVGVCPLVGPSDIRTKYLSAMQEHVITDKCTFCLEVHAMEGEKYIVELERALTQAWEETTLEVS